MSPAKQIAGFISKFDPAVAKLIISVRSALRNRFPTANEAGLLRQLQLFSIIGYCSTEQAADCIVSLAKGVSLSFYYGATFPDPHKLLEGSGNRNPFISLES